MALKEWMIRKGAPGGTARKVAEIYLHALKQNPKITIDEFCERFWMMRAQVGNYDPNNQLAKLSGMTSDFTKWSSSLSRLVADVLSIEVGDDFDDLYLNDMEMRNLYNKVIREELAKCGVPSDVI